MSWKVPIGFDWRWWRRLAIKCTSHYVFYHGNLFDLRKCQSCFLERCRILNRYSFVQTLWGLVKYQDCCCLNVASMFDEIAGETRRRSWCIRRCKSWETVRRHRAPLLCFVLLHLKIQLFNFSCMESGALKVLYLILTLHKTHEDCWVNDATHEDCWLNEMLWKGELSLVYQL